MKTYTTILILAAALFAHSAARAADNSLELVLSDDHVVFSTATNISMEMIFRNVGETNMRRYALLADTLVVLDGKEFKRAPFSYEGLLGVFRRVVGANVLYFRSFAFR